MESRASLSYVLSNTYSCKIGSNTSTPGSWPYLRKSKSSPRVLEEVSGAGEFAEEEVRDGDILEGTDVDGRGLE